MENDELLQAIGTMLQPIHTRLNKIDTRLNKIDMRLDKIEQDVTEVKQRTTKIEVTLENQTNKSIQLLAEGHANVVEKLTKLDDISKMAEDTKMKVDVMYTVVKKHNVDINELKLAK